MLIVYGSWTSPVFLSGCVSASTAWWPDGQYSHKLPSKCVAVKLFFVMLVPENDTHTLLTCKLALIEYSPGYKLKYLYNKTCPLNVCMWTRLAVTLLSLDKLLWSIQMDPIWSVLNCSAYIYFFFFVYIRFILAKLLGESVVKGCKSGHDSF